MKTLLIVMTLAVLPFDLAAAILHVPGDSPTLKGAVQRARSGDTIVLAPGTYAGRTHLGEEGILIDKSLTIVGSPHAQTLIDCQGTEDNRRRAFKITENRGQLAEQVTIKLQHLTFANGWHEGGGAVFIEDNTSTSASPADKVFDRVVVEIDNCLFDNNVSRGFSNGGGVYCRFATCHLSHCDFLSNAAVAGSGVCIEQGSGSVARCHFEDNGPLRNEIFEISFGGGLLLINVQDNFNIDNSSFLNNRSYFGGGLTISHQRFCRDDTDALCPVVIPRIFVNVTNCLITRNGGFLAKAVSVAGTYGPGVKTHFQNCTFADNTRETFEDGDEFLNNPIGPAFFLSAASVEFNSCILDDDRRPHILKDRLGETVIIDDSCLNFNWPGQGRRNIQGSARFTDSAGRDNNPFNDYLLSRSSPCVDSANGGFAPLTDFQGARRVDDKEAENIGASRIRIADMGCFERLERGDTDEDGSPLNITDGIFILNHLFANGPASRNAETMDVNRDGGVNLTDVVRLFNFLFMGGPDIPPLP